MYRIAGVTIDDQVERDVKERKGRSIVTTTLSCKEMAYVGWHMLVGIFTTNHGGSENWVCGGQARSYCETRQKVEAWYEGVDECGRHKPPLSNVLGMQ